MLTKIGIAAAGALIAGSWIHSGLAQEADTITWDIRISGDRTDTCEDIWQLDGTSISTEISCSAYGTGTTSGSIDPDTGAFALSGIVGGYQLQSQGTLSLDGTAIGGSWSLTDPPVSGTFVGQLLQVPPSTETPPSTATASVTQVEPTGVPAAATPVAPSLPDTGDSGSGGGQTPFLAASAVLAAAIVLSLSGFIWRRQS